MKNQNNIFSCLDKQLAIALNHLKLLYNNRSYDRCKTLSGRYIKICENYINLDNIDSESKNYLRVISLFFRGFIDYIDLMKIMNSIDIHSDIEYKKIENMWDILCDIKINIPYIKIIKHPLVKFIIEKSSEIDKWFLDYFGPGLYFSTVILCDYKCNICNNNIDDCEHIPGTIYNGTICQKVGYNIKNILSVDIVKNPADPKCRIWSWNKNDDGTYSARIMTLNSN